MSQDSGAVISHSSRKFGAVLLIIMVAGAAIVGTYLFLTTRNKVASSSFSLQSLSLYAPGDFPNETGTPSTGGTLAYVLEFVTHETTGTLAITVNGSEISSAQLSDVIDISLAQLQAQNYTVVSQSSISWDSGTGPLIVAHQTYNVTISVTFSNSQPFKISMLLKAT